MYIQENLKEGLLGGHEMHHNLRKPKTFENIPEHQKGIMYVLNAIVNEGTADMIDKPLDLLLMMQNYLWVLSLKNFF